MGEVLPDQPGRSDRKFTSDLAIGSIIGTACSWGPKRPLTAIRARPNFP